MITNPIIPIWLMLLICIALIILIVYNKKEINTRNKNETKWISLVLKVLAVIILFVINLRIMIPNGESKIITSDLSVLFVIDKSVSMRALDYNGNHERFEGVIEDCTYIVNELSGAKFSVITFGNEARKLIPFTQDSDMVISELKAINLEYDYYAQGTSINSVRDVIEKELDNETQRKNGASKLVLFFITDGEITKSRRNAKFF